MGRGAWQATVHVLYCVLQYSNKRVGYDLATKQEQQIVSNIFTM